MSNCEDHQMTVATEASNSSIGDQPSALPPPTTTAKVAEPVAPPPAASAEVVAPAPAATVAVETETVVTTVETAAVAAASTASAAKRNRRSRRDRRRRKGQNEGASLTRLAALLGQIKEACNKEGERSAIAVKVAPMIESATKIVENFSQAQQKANTEAAPSPSTQTEATVPTTSGSPAKVAKTSPTEDSTMNTSANMKIRENNQRAMSRRLPRGELWWLTPSTLGTDLMPGMKIPPHFYKPQPAAFDFGHSPFSPPAQAMNNYPKSVFPPLKPRPVASKHTRETIKREKEQLEVRNDLRNARTVADYERVLAIADRLKMDYESQAARTRIVKLQQTPTTTTVAAVEAQADKVLVA